MADTPSPTLLRRFYDRHRHECNLGLAIVSVLVLTATLDAQHNYLNIPADSARNIVRQTSLMGIFSLGAALVIISGGIDLSAGSVIAFSGTICGTILLLIAPEDMAADRSLSNGTIVVAIVGTLFVGLLIGCLHAWLITGVGLPPFVATLATLVGLRSFGRAICDRMTEAVKGKRVSQIQIYDSHFRSLGQTVWIVALTFAVCAAACWLLLSRTVAGRHIYAMGGNEEAARLSGIRTNRLKWLAYSISATLSSVAGILLVGYTGQADPQGDGMGYELIAIAGAVVGGCSLAGGVGTIPGTVLGSLFLQTIIDGVDKTIKRGAEIFQGMIVGVVVVLAVTFSQLESGRHRRRYFTGLLGVAAIFTLSLLAATLAWLVGPGLLAGKSSLDGKFLGALVFVGAVLALSLAASRLGPNPKRWLAVALAVGWIVSAVVIDRNLPAYRYRAAIAAVERAGGRSEEVEDGTAVDLGGIELDDSRLKKLLEHLQYVTDLTELRLNGTQVTDDSMKALGRMLGRGDDTTLRRLYLKDTPVKRIGERHVERSIPDVEIFR